MVQFFFFAKLVYIRLRYLLEPQKDPALNDEWQEAEEKYPKSIKSCPNVMAWRVPSEIDSAACQEICKEKEKYYCRNDRFSQLLDA